MEWSFINRALTFFNFPPKLISLIMSCVSTTSSPILFNGSPTSLFTPSRGIRQGDPLSPYLFILCMEMLSRQIHTVVDYNLWQPISSATNGPPISHIFFDNDIILASKITTPSCHKIITFLNNLLSTRGNFFFFEKSKIFFFTYCPPTAKTISCVVSI